jgi:ssDNA-binding Zn-finger/Zn-ribbon topoisomerase 1
MLVVLALSIAAGMWRRARIERARRKKYERQASAVDPPTIEAVVRCPRCNSYMRRRLAKRGRNKGAYFWGCSRYPKCKGTRESLTECT